MAIQFNQKSRCQLHISKLILVVVTTVINSNAILAQESLSNKFSDKISLVSNDMKLIEFPSDLYFSSQKIIPLSQIIDKENFLLGDSPHYNTNKFYCNNKNKELYNIGEINKNISTLDEIELCGTERKLSNLKFKAAQLEAQKFSPITQLRGQAIFASAAAFGGKKIDETDKNIDSEPIVGSRLRLTFDTSFNGRDRLRVRVQARNITNLKDITGTQMSDLSFDGDDDNELRLSGLKYEFPIGDNTRFYVGAQGAGLKDYVKSVNKYFDSSARGSISAFGRQNPITRQGGGTGVGISHDFSKNINLGLGYVSNNARNPNIGLFDGRYGAIAQLTINPNKKSRIAFIYVRSLNNIDTRISSQLASNPFDNKNSESALIFANSFSTEASFDIFSNIALGGNIGIIEATSRDLESTPSARIFTWSIQLALRDIAIEDSLLGVVIGQPPTLVKNELPNISIDKNTPLHLELFYRFNINKNISITPGMISIFNPESNSNNDNVFAGVLRTTFNF